MPQVNINVKNEVDSKIQKDIKKDAKYENESTINKNDYINKQVELVWKKFLDSNPELLKKLSSLDSDSIKNASSAGSILIANGMYNEAKEWKEYRRKELSKEGIKDLDN